MLISGAGYGKRKSGSVRAKKAGKITCFLATRSRGHWAPDNNASA